MKCPNCGAKLDKSATYCDNCAEIFDNNTSNKSTSDIENKQMDRFERDKDYINISKKSGDLKNNPKLLNTKKNKYVRPDSDSYPEEVLPNKSLNKKLKAYLGDLEPDKNVVAILIAGVLGGLIFSYFFSSINITIVSIPALIIIMTILNSEKEAKRSISRLYDLGYYDQAHDKIIDLYEKTKNSDFLKQAILIEAYELEDIELAVKNINKLSKDERSDQNMIDAQEHIDEAHGG